MPHGRMPVIISLLYIKGFAISLKVPSPPIAIMILNPSFDAYIAISVA